MLKPCGFTWIHLPADAIFSIYMQSKCYLFVVKFQDLIKCTPTGDVHYDTLQKAFNISQNYLNQQGNFDERFEVTCHSFVIS